MLLEFVGGPLCGQGHNVNALPAEYDAVYLPAPGQEWRVTYQRSGLRMARDSRVFRYNFAGQRLAQPVAKS
jgi:hypothetical protein